MKYAKLRQLSGRTPRSRWIASFIFLLTVLTAPAAAQIGRSSHVNTVGGPATLGGYAIKGNDIAYDPARDVYLIIHGFFGPVVGIFVDRYSEPVSGYFVIGSAPAHFPRARYSQHLNGGQGGFMVSWAVEGNGNGNHEVHTRAVAYPGALLGNEQVISDVTSPPWLESGISIAYSPVSQLFLVAWQTYPHVANPGVRLAARFIDLNGAGVGAIGRLSSGFGQYPSVAWNSVSNEFGVSFTAENAAGTTSFTVLSVVSPGDVNITAPIRQTFSQSVGYGFITDLDYNPDTNRYIVGWHQQPAGIGPEMRVAELDAATNLVSTGLLSSLLWGMNSLSVSFSPVSRTFLFSSLDNNDYTAGFELNSRGFPTSARTVLVSNVTTRYNRASPSTVRPEWSSAFSDFYRSLKGFPTSTTSTGGGGGGAWGSAPPPGPTPTPTPTPTPAPGPTGCTSAAPGAGWVCVNGNWLPPDYSSPTPPPPPPPPSPTPTPPPSAGCPGAAPVSGWVCVNGNWLPPDFPGVAPTPTPSPTPTPTPPPAPSSAGCPGSAPVAGWVCWNGNWVPPDYPGAPQPTPPSSTGCVGAAPGPGWVCSNGNWLPPDFPTSVGCPGAAPVAGWVCLNGNWVPPDYPGVAGCAGPDPFVGLPGILYGLCVNGNWIPVMGAPESSPSHAFLQALRSSSVRDGSFERRPVAVRLTARS